jgi:hypothetical protein
VINQMRERYATDSGIEWKHADVRDLPESACSVDIAFDKGTLDAMIFGSPWSPPESVKENAGRYMDEVSHNFKLQEHKYTNCTSSGGLKFITDNQRSQEY